MASSQWQQQQPAILLPPDPPPAESLWQGPQLVGHIEQLVSRLELLKSLSLELEVIAALRIKPEQAGASHAAFEGDESKSCLYKALLNRLGNDGSKLKQAETMALRAAKKVQSSVQELLGPLEAVTTGKAGWSRLSAVERLRQRKMKLLRNRRRRQKRRQETAQYRDKAAERFQQAEQKADEWLERERAKDLAKRKMEEMQKLAEKKAKEERVRLEQELEMTLLVDKLQELRSLRVEKLKKQGRLFPEEDDKFMERVRAAVQEEERLAAAEAAKASGGRNASAASSSSTEQQPSQEPTQPPQTSSSKQVSRGLEAPPNLPAQFYRYYYGSKLDMGTLIEVRRSWDNFIFPGGGSRIPGHWVQPGPPSSEVWASYLVSTAKEAS